MPQICRWVPLHILWCMYFARAAPSFMSTIRTELTSCSCSSTSYHTYSNNYTWQILDHQRHFDLDLTESNLVISATVISDFQFLFFFLLPTLWLSGFSWAHNEIRMLSHLKRCVLALGPYLGPMLQWIRVVKKFEWYKDYLTY